MLYKFVVKVEWLDKPHLFTLNAWHQRGKGGVEFYVFGTNYQGFYN